MTAPAGYGQENPQGFAGGGDTGPGYPQGAYTGGYGPAPMPYPAGPGHPSYPVRPGTQLSTITRVVAVLVAIFGLAGFIIALTIGKVTSSDSDSDYSFAWAPTGYKVFLGFTSLTLGLGLGMLLWVAAAWLKRQGD